MPSTKPMDADQAKAAREAAGITVLPLRLEIRDRRTLVINGSEFRLRKQGTLTAALAEHGFSISRPRVGSTWESPTGDELFVVYNGGQDYWPGDPLAADEHVVCYPSKSNPDEPVLVLSGVAR